MERAESYARRLGAYKLELNVSSQNEAGGAFYRRLGYEPRVLVMSKRM
jgi:GNAT superfamily N-acetyltransferase